MSLVPGVFLALSTSVSCPALFQLLLFWKAGGKQAEEVGPCAEMIRAVAHVLFPWSRNCFYIPQSNDDNNYKLLWERGL